VQRLWPRASKSRSDELCEELATNSNSSECRRCLSHLHLQKRSCQISCKENADAGFNIGSENCGSQQPGDPQALMHTPVCNKAGMDARITLVLRKAYFRRLHTSTPNMNRALAAEERSGAESVTNDNPSVVLMLGVLVLHVSYL